MPTTLAKCNSTRCCC